MRVRTGGSHHQKLVVIRYAGRPERDIAFVGGIDLCHSRRDDARHLGDPQAQSMAAAYGEHPAWHDIQAAISGPAVLRRRDGVPGALDGSDAAEPEPDPAAARPLGRK